MTTLDRRAPDPRVQKLVEDVDTLKSDVSLIQKNTADMVEFWKAAEGGIKVLGWLGKLAKIIAAIAAAAGSVYALFHLCGDLPKTK